MEINNIIKQLRTANNLTQGQLAERLMVTRQAVSRWENGETQPNIETLKLLSREFNVSINTLLGSPRQLNNARLTPADQMLAKVTRIAGIIFFVVAILACVFASRLA